MNPAPGQSFPLGATVVAVRIFATLHVVETSSAKQGVSFFSRSN